MLKGLHKTSNSKVLFAHKKRFFSAISSGKRVPFYYNVKEALKDEELQVLIQRGKNLRDQIFSNPAHDNLNPRIWNLIHVQNRMEYITKVNAQEGSSLTFEETSELLRFSNVIVTGNSPRGVIQSVEKAETRVTEDDEHFALDDSYDYNELPEEKRASDKGIAAKPIKDYIDAMNHLEAVEHIFEIRESDTPATASSRQVLDRVFNEELFKKLNLMLLSRYPSNRQQMNAQSFGSKMFYMAQKNAKPGSYRPVSSSVTVQGPSSSVIDFVNPAEIAKQMGDLVNWMQNEGLVHDPVVSTAVALCNFMRIAPFAEGNLRVGCLVANSLLLNLGKFSILTVFDDTNKLDQVLEECIEEKSIVQMCNYVAKNVISTHEQVLYDLQKYSQTLGR